MVKKVSQKGDTWITPVGLLVLVFRKNVHKFPKPNIFIFCRLLASQKKFDPPFRPFFSPSNGKKTYFSRGQNQLKYQHFKVFCQFLKYRPIRHFFLSAFKHFYYKKSCSGIKFLFHCKKALQLYGVWKDMPIQTLDLLRVTEI